MTETVGALLVMEIRASAGTTAEVEPALLPYEAFQSQTGCIIPNLKLSIRGVIPALVAGIDGIEYQ